MKEKELKKINKIKKLSKYDDLYNKINFGESQFVLGNNIYFPQLLLKNPRWQVLYYKCKKVNKNKYEKNPEIINDKKTKYSVYIFTFNKENEAEIIIKYFTTVKSFSKIKFEIKYFKDERKLYLAENYYHFIPLNHFINSFKYSVKLKKIFLECKKIVYKIITELWFYILRFKNEISKKEIQLITNDIYLYFDNDHCTSLENMFENMEVRIENKNKYFINLILKLILNKNQKTYNEIKENFNRIVNKFDNEKIKHKNKEEIYFSRIILDIFYFSCNNKEFFQLLDNIDKKEINELIENDENNKELVKNYDNIYIQNKLIFSINNWDNKSVYNNINFSFVNKKLIKYNSQENLLYDKNELSDLISIKSKNNIVSSIPDINYYNKFEIYDIQNDFLSKDNIMMGMIKILFRNKTKENQNIFFSEDNKILLFIYNAINQELKDINILGNLSQKFQKNLLILLGGIVNEKNIFEILSSEYLYFFEIEELYSFIISSFSRNIIKELSKLCFFEGMNDNLKNKLNIMLIYLNKLFNSIEGIQILKLKNLLIKKKGIEFFIMVSKMLEINTIIDKDLFESLFEFFSHLYSNLNNEKLFFIQKNFNLFKNYNKIIFILNDEYLLKIFICLNSEREREIILEYLRKIPFIFRKNKDNVIKTLSHYILKYDKTTLIHHEILKTIINYLELEFWEKLGHLNKCCLKDYFENKLKIYNIIDFKNLYSYQYGYYCFSCDNIKICLNCSFNCHKFHEILPSNYELFDCECKSNCNLKNEEIPNYLYRFNFIKQDINFKKSENIEITENLINFTENKLNIVYIENTINNNNKVNNLSKNYTKFYIDIKFKNLKNGKKFNLGFDKIIDFKDPLKNDFLIKINSKSSIGEFSELYYDSSLLKIENENTNLLRRFNNNNLKRIKTMHIDKYLESFKNEEVIKSFRITNKNENKILKFNLPIISKNDSINFIINNDNKIILMMNHNKIITFIYKGSNLYFCIKSLDKLKIKYIINDGFNIKNLFSGKDELIWKKNINWCLSKFLNFDENIMVHNNHKKLFISKKKIQLKKIKRNIKSEIKNYFLKNKKKIFIIFISIIILLVILILILIFTIN